MNYSIQPEQRNKIVKILKDISRQCDLDAIAVVTVEGKELAFFAQKGTDPAIMAALSSALNSAGQQAANQIKYGVLDQLIIKGTEGFMILQNAGKVIIFGASREIFSLALSMNIINRYKDEVNNTFD